MGLWVGRPGEKVEAGSDLWLESYLCYQPRLPQFGCSELPHPAAAYYTAGDIFPFPQVAWQQLRALTLIWGRHVGLPILTLVWIELKARVRARARVINYVNDRVNILESPQWQ